MSKNGTDTDKHRIADINTELVLRMYPIQSVYNMHVYSFNVKKFHILWTVHHDTHMWERHTRCTLFLNKLFQLNYPRHVSNK